MRRAPILPAVLIVAFYLTGCGGGADKTDKKQAQQPAAGVDGRQQVIGGWTLDTEAMAKVPDAKQPVIEAMSQASLVFEKDKMGILAGGRTKLAKYTVVSSHPNELVIVTDDRDVFLIRFHDGDRMSMVDHRRMEPRDLMIFKRATGVPATLPEGDASRRDFPPPRPKAPVKRYDKDDKEYKYKSKF